jgi:hypothetical protein
VLSLGDGRYLRRMMCLGDARYINAVLPVNDEQISTVGVKHLCIRNPNASMPTQHGLLNSLQAH